MQTQISITVRDESFISKAFTLMWFINIFKKSKLMVSIDGNVRECMASKTPYVFNVTPGNHVIEIYDPKAKQKSFTRSMTGAFMGGIVGLAGGGVYSTITGATVGSKLGELSIRDNVVNCALNPGDLLKLSCKCNSKGAVKIKQIM